MRPPHEPVLVAETLGFLARGPGLYLDATLGDGGHAEALLAREPAARLLGCDRDPEAIDFARRRLAAFGDRVTLAQARFRELPNVHRDLGGEPLTGALLDLGVSSHQLDEPERGFAFQSSGPLDLRMEPNSGEPAAERLAHADVEEVADVLRRHGDVREARRLAGALVRAAVEGRLRTTADARTIVERTLRGPSHPRRLAPVFQALRIWVNDEAAELEAVLDWLPEAVRVGGVVVTLAYHSGEDRRIKGALRPAPPTRIARQREPAEHAAQGPWQELTRRVVKPSEAEKARNPRARSARLRAFQRRSS